MNGGLYVGDGTHSAGDTLSFVTVIYCIICPFPSTNDQKSILYYCLIGRAYASYKRCALGA